MKRKVMRLAEDVFLSLIDIKNEWLKQTGEQVDDEITWDYQETRQTYRIIEETSRSIKVEAYEVAIYKTTDDIRTEVEDYLWGDWFLKREIKEWPDPLAEAYLDAKVGSPSIPTNDFWVL